MHGTQSIVGLLVLLYVVAAAKVPATDSTWQLQIDLVDGSRVIGQPQKESLSIDIGFAQLEIPWQRIRRAEWKPDGVVRVELTNGDLLSGRVTPRAVHLTTVFGEITVSMKLFAAVEIVPPSRTAWLPTRKGLVLYYAAAAEKEDRLINLAVDQHHAQLQGATFVEDGKDYGAIEFNGQSNAVVPHHPDLCPNQLTLAAWFKQQGASSNYQLLLAKAAPSSWNGGYGFVRMSGDSQHLHFFINSYSDKVVKAEVVTDRWVHLAGTYNGRSLKLYRNGELVDHLEISADSTTQPIQHSDSPLLLGGDTSGYTWRGRMDEVVLYRRALSDQEIKGLYDTAAGSFKARSL